VNERLAIVLINAVALPTKPGQVGLVLRNQSEQRLEVIRSVVEVKRSYVGARHALPRVGWGYAVTTSVTPKTILAPLSELWTKFELDTRTSFGGLIPPDEPPLDAHQLFLGGVLLYRRRRGELLETTFCRRLTYPELVFDTVDATDRDLIREGRVIFHFAGPDTA
jgi:hypothetical protein